MSLIGRGAIGKIPTVSCISNVSMGKPNNICNNSICMKIVNLRVYPETKTRQQRWKSFLERGFWRSRTSAAVKKILDPRTQGNWKAIEWMSRILQQTNKWLVNCITIEQTCHWHLKSIFGRNYFWTTLTNTLCHTGRLDNSSSKYSFWQIIQNKWWRLGSSDFRIQEVITNRQENSMKYSHLPVWKSSFPLWN